VRLLTRDPASHPWLSRFPNIKIIRGDINDAECIAEAVVGCSYVVHAAGLFRFWGPRQVFEETNVDGTENILRAVVKAPVQKLIYISTIALIGTPDPNRVVDENHPAHPADNYQWSKLHAEQLIWRYQAEQGVPALIIRPGAFLRPARRLRFQSPVLPRSFCAASSCRSTAGAT